MKAINKNKKYALPLMLLGLLALDTSWHKIFYGTQTQSGSFASESAETIRAKKADITKRTSQLCSQSNDILPAVAAAKSNGSSSYYFTTNDDTEFKKTISQSGKSVDIKYNAKAVIERVTKEPVELSEANQKMGNVNFLESSDDSKILHSLEKEETVTLTNCKNTKWIGTDKCQLTGRPKYHVFRIKVSSQTTEGDWCDDCDNESKTVDSEYRYFKVKVWPKPDSNTTVCKTTQTHALELFSQTELDLQKGIAKDIKDIAKLAEQEALEEYRDQLVEDCKIRPDATIADVKAYKRNRSIRKEMSYEGHPEDTLECKMQQVENSDNAFERSNKFQAAVLPTINQMLTSTNPIEQQKGQVMLTQLQAGEFGDLERTELQLLSATSFGANRYKQIAQLRQRVVANPNDNSAQFNLQNLELDTKMRLGQYTNSGFSNPLTQELSYWESQIFSNDLTALTSPTNVSTSTVPITASSSSMSYNFDGRVARLTSGHTPLGQEFQNVRASILNTPDFVNNGISPLGVYSTGNGIDAARFSTTQPPRPEMSTGSQRLVRNRN